MGITCHSRSTLHYFLANTLCRMSEWVILISSKLHSAYINTPTTTSVKEADKEQSWGDLQV